MTQAAPRDGGTQKCVIPAVEDKDIGLVSLPFFQFLLPGTTDCLSGRASSGRCPEFNSIFSRLIRIE